MMKNRLTYLTALAIGSAMLFLVGCSDDDEPVVPAAPTATISVPGLTPTGSEYSVSVTKDSTLVVSYSISAPALVKTLSHSINGVSESVSAAVGDDSYSRQVILNLPFEDTTIDFKVEVTDERDQVLTTSIKIAVTALVPPSIPLTEAQMITMGGPISPGNFSRWDLDIPEGYGGFSLGGANADKVPNMDVFYKTLSLNDTDTEVGHERFADSGAKFLITEFTKAEFDAMDNDVELTKLNINQTYLQFIEVGQVIAFQTNLGKKGLMYLSSYNQGADDLDVIIKMQEL